MFSNFAELNPAVQGLCAGIFTWGLTMLGAATVFLIKTMDQRIMDGMLGFAAGIMVAASFWSLLAPAIALEEAAGNIAWISVSIGFIAGGICLWVIDKILPHLHPGYPISAAEGIHTKWQRSVLLVLAITLHNIPEGLAVGVAFGAVGAGIENATLGAAISLAVGIGLQNFPEGSAVSMPLVRDGISKRKAFFFGQLSGAVEPIFAFLGALIVGFFAPILPYALAFAAGAMIYVVVEELIPEAQRDERTHISTFGFLIGFAIMMILDVALS